MGDENQNQQQGKQAKSGADLLKQIREKNYQTDLGKIKKQIEDKMPLQSKAEEALDQINSEIDALVAQYDELLSKKAAVAK
jgi:hypothetical protein